MIALSTYSGECDGLGYAAEMAGIEVAAYCEADKKRRAQLAKRNPGKPIFESDTELTKDELHKAGIYPDIIFGGPPCQPFSVAGDQRGTDDPRHRWPEMLRIIQECRPSWVLVENVGGFVNMALDLVLSDLEAEGYETGATVLPAIAVGAPHRRDRCFVVAHSNSGRQTEQGDGDDQLRLSKTFRTGERGGMGYAERSGQERIDGRRTSEEPPGRCKGMADTISTRESQQSGQLAKCRGRALDSSESLVNAESDRVDARSLSGRDAQEQSEPDSRNQDGLFRAAQSRLGRVLDGVSHRLDEQMSKWPAWRGQEQHPWEPPRTVLGMKERPRRIESLGLAVVPWQAYPIFALIKEMDDILREVGT